MVLGLVVVVIHRGQMAAGLEVLNDRLIEGGGRWLEVGGGGVIVGGGVEAGGGIYGA